MPYPEGRERYSREGTQKIKVKFGGGCSVCNAPLQPGDDGMYNYAEKKLTCVECYGKQGQPNVAAKADDDIPF